MKRSGRETIVLERRFVPNGSVIIQQGEPGSTAYLIQSGRVRIYTEDDEARQIELAKMGVGQIFGEMALVFDGPRTASVQAIEECNLIVISRETFRQKLERSDPTVNAMVEMLTRRIMDINNTLINKKSSIEDLTDAASAIYQNVLQSLPRSQQRTFQNAILPKLDAFLSSIASFNERFAERDRSGDA